MKSLYRCAIFLFLLACTPTEEVMKSEVGQTPFRVKVRTFGEMGISGADMIQGMAVYFVVPFSGTFIKKVDAMVSSDGAEISLNTKIPAMYNDQEICAYFIANAFALSDSLDMKSGAIFDISRFDNLSTQALLNGENAKFVISGKVLFQANGEDISGGEVKFDRTFAKVYLAPADGMSLEQQREVKVVSVEIVNGRAAGYLFQNAVFPERIASRLLPVDVTMDQMNIDRPVCYLYPDTGGTDGGYLVVKLKNTANGRIVSKRVMLRPQKNTAHKLTIEVLPGEDGGYAIQVSDWDKDILLPEAGADVSSSLLPDEGIDLVNVPEVFYYYNQLTLIEQELYRSLFGKANYFTENLMPGERLIVDLPDNLQGKFTDIQFQKVANYLLNDMAVLFNTGIITKYRTGIEGKVVSYRMQLIAMRPLFDIRVGLVLQAAREFLDHIPKGLAEFDRVKIVHDLFLRSVSYGGMNSAQAGDIVGGLVNKKIVCEGYARTFQYLLQRVGIQAIFVGGEVMSSGKWTKHAWNMVRIDSKYYFVDPTWNDGPTSLPDLLGHKYFLKSKTFMDKTHRLQMELPLPECLEDYPFPNP